MVNKNLAYIFRCVWFWANLVVGLITIVVFVIAVMVMNTMVLLLLVTMLCKYGILIVGQFHIGVYEIIPKSIKYNLEL